MKFIGESIKEVTSYYKERMVGHHLSHPFLYSENIIFFRHSGEERRFILALDERTPLFYLRKEGMDSSSIRNSFIQQLQKELNNAYVVDIEQINGDRIVRFTLTIINNVYKEEGRYLYFEMIPHHVNLIVTDLENKILLAYKPGTLTEGRNFLRGMHYEAPNNPDFPDKPPLFSINEYLELTYEKEEEFAKKRIKDLYGPFIKEAEKRHKSLLRRIDNINSDVKRAKTHLDDGDYGNFIYMNFPNLQQKLPSIDYYGEIIELDPKKTLGQNAELFFKKVKKSKQAILMSEDNLRKALEELEEQEIILKQISGADEEGLEAIFKGVTLSKKQKRKNENPMLGSASLPYYVELGETKIVFGKNSKQNAYLTFVYDTVKTHLWFHLNGDSGSHVMIKKENPTKEEILLAEEIALLGSGREDGEIMKTLRKNVRKGNSFGQVVIKEYEDVRLDKVREKSKELFKKAKKVEL
ncbi:MAG: NFACT family protein [Bacilli bacterium]|nr:NFACT family protein [Bacilli bacterium]